MKNSQYIPINAYKCVFASDGENDSSVPDKDASTNPIPLQRTKPISTAPLMPREPPPRQPLISRAASRHERPSDPDAGKVDDARPQADSSSAANGESGIYVSRMPSLKSRRPALKGGTSANREGMTQPLCSCSYGDMEIVHKKENVSHLFKTSSACLISFLYCRCNDRASCVTSGPFR